MLPCTLDQTTPRTEFFLLQQSTQNTTQSFSLKSLRVTATSQLAQLVCTTCGKQGVWVLAKSKTPHSLCLQSSSYLGFALYKTAKLNTTQRCFWQLLATRHLATEVHPFYKQHNNCTNNSTYVDGDFLRSCFLTRPSTCPLHPIALPSWGHFLDLDANGLTSCANFLEATKLCKT